MGYIILDRESDGSSMRQQMRRNMRGGDYHTGRVSMRGGYDEGYRQGYKHGWEDSEEEDWEDGEHYRKRR